MKMPRGPAAGLCAILAMTGCAGGRVYENGINHVYLCAVRVVRENGYQVRQQEFRKRSGKMVAARSVPDPKETLIRRGFFKRVSEVVSNTIEHSKLEFWDRDLAAARVRTDKRVVAKFKARRGFLWFGSPRRTKVKFSIDSTDYGREDWVIRRERIRAGGREELYQALARCLEGEKGPVIIATATPSATPTASPTATPSVAPSAAPSAEKPAVERAKPAPKQKPAKALAQKAPAEAAPEPPELEPSKEQAPIERVEPARKQEAPAELGPLASVAPKAPAAAAATPTSSQEAPILLSPEELEEQIERGRKAYEAGKYEKTVQLLEIAIHTDPKNPEALGYLGAANYQLGRFAQAILMYERYLQIVPDDLRTEDFLKEIRKSQKEKDQSQ